MDNVGNSQQIKAWKISTIIFLCLSLVLVVLTTIKYLPKKEFVAKQNKTADTTEIASKDSLFFSKQHLDQQLSQYEYTLLASPDVLNEQKDKFWKPLECIHSSIERSRYTILDIKKYIKDEALLKGLQSIEDNKFKITIKDADGVILEEYTSLQNISYTQICKDSKNYYVLFLTKGDRSSNRSSLFIKEVKAGGGWLGYSNFAVIPFSGEMKIYEKIDSGSKNIAVNDLLESGFTSPTSRSFAYYSCSKFIGKLGEDLYAICGGEGESGLFKITQNPLTFSEISFCRWIMSEGSWVCYDIQGKRYYHYQYR